VLCLLLLSGRLYGQGEHLLDRWQILRMHIQKITLKAIPDSILWQAQQSVCCRRYITIGMAIKVILLIICVEAP
jgi:hypothetical protein